MKIKKLKRRKFQINTTYKEKNKVETGNWTPASESTSCINPIKHYKMPVLSSQYLRKGRKT